MHRLWNIDEQRAFVINKNGYVERFAQFASYLDRALQMTNVLFAAAAIHQGVFFHGLVALCFEGIRPRYAGYLI